MEIPLIGQGAGLVALVDDADFAALAGHRWRLDARKDGMRYAKTGREHPVRMHVLIMGRPGVDHRDGDGLNNQRSNLRFASALEQQGNRRKQRRGVTTSRFKGVYREKRCPLRPWAAVIRVSGKMRGLGYYADEEDAARAYDAAAREVFGEFALLNFPEVE